MKATDYEELLTEIENEHWNQNISVSDFYILFGHKIRTFREAQQKLISDPIEFAKKVCELSGCIYIDLYTKSRKNEIVRARQIVLVAFVNVFKMKLQEAAKKINHDHSSYYHSFKTIKNLNETNKEYQEIFSGLLKIYPEILNFKP